MYNEIFFFLSGQIYLNNGIEFQVQIWKFQNLEHFRLDRAVWREPFASSETSTVPFYVGLHLNTCPEFPSPHGLFPICS